VVHLGWVACSGDVFPDLSSEFEDPPMALSTATFVIDVMGTLPPAVAISHAAAAITDVLPVAGGPSTARKPYGGRDSARSNPSVCHRSDPALSHGGLGSREGFAPRRLRHDSVQRACIFV
jgi:hypothetical protein